MYSNNAVFFFKNAILVSFWSLEIVETCNRLEHMQLSGRAPVVAQPAMYRQSKSNLYGFKWISYHSTLSFRS